MSGYTKNKPPKASYSKVNTYDGCGWRYYLTYEQNYFFFGESLSADFGSLVHYFEQKIFEALKKGNPVDYESIREEFKTINIPKKDRFDTEGGIYGTDILLEKYGKEYYETDELGDSYFSKAEKYLNTGMYRLEDYLKENPDLCPWAAEFYFSVLFEGYCFSGHIDRIFYNEKTDKYIIEDIKTKAKPFKDKELVTPLQFAIYCMGMKEGLDIPYEKMSCRYDLPFLNMKQDAEKGFVSRGIAKLEKILKGIKEKDWTPHPSALCYYCPYCNANPGQPEGAENLCPYYSLWTPEKKSQDVASEWEGFDKHEDVMREFLKEYGKKIQVKKVVDDFDFEF